MLDEPWVIKQENRQNKEGQLESSLGDPRTIKQRLFKKWDVGLDGEGKAYEMAKGMLDEGHPTLRILQENIEKTRAMRDEQ